MMLNVGTLVLLMPPNKVHGRIMAVMVGIVLVLLGGGGCGWRQLFSIICGGKVKESGVSSSVEKARLARNFSRLSSYGSKKWRASFSIQL